MIYKTLTIDGALRPRKAYEGKYDADLIGAILALKKQGMRVWGVLPDTVPKWPYNLVPF